MSVDRSLRDLPSSLPLSREIESLVGGAPSLGRFFALGLLFSLCSNLAVAQSTGLMASVDPDSTETADKESSTGARHQDFGYGEGLDRLVQESCLVCHRAGAIAPTNGARLVLGEDAQTNHEAFSEFLSMQGGDVDFLLGKVSGKAEHGGGTVAAEGSLLYQGLSDYLSELSGEESRPVDQSSDFWVGTVQEPRDITLRRALHLFSAQIPSEEAIGLALESDIGLRQAVKQTMTGQGFHEFILQGADDRLLIEGLLNGIDFNIATRDRYPELSQLLIGLPDQRPEQYDDYHDEPFLTEGDADWTVRWAISREPLELIAYVIERDLPYKKILTADYTMVNAFTDLAYRSETGFDHDFADERGFYDRSRYNDFRPGKNRGHIPHDYAFIFDDENGISGFSGYQNWPHSGILTTQAWLSRYPSTDTNRNRARARWTYQHFLGVDIEKSAPRTTDPVALADTNNPTLNNGACTVCHERLDPMAGAYQSFGDFGHYLDQYGGEDSLADSYKCPECYGGESGSTGYQQGDTWYRDMRAPGFEEKKARGSRDSIQWLGYQIANDPRFAEATVRFWWPAVFGTDLLTAPSDPEGPYYSQQLRAFSEQQTTISELASVFEKSGFSAKTLFAEMVMTPWYRNSSVSEESVAQSRAVELETVGRGRLLTPEELDRKTLALFGRTWRQWTVGTNAHDFSRETALSGHRATFKGFYGGMDGAAVVVRNRELTPLMSNVNEAMASELACQLVLEDFNRDADARKAFTLVDRDTLPGRIFGITESWPFSKTQERHSVKLAADIELVGGDFKIRVHDLTPRLQPGRSDSGPDHWSELSLDKVVFKQSGATRQTMSGKSIRYLPSFVADTWTDDEGRTHWRGRSTDHGWTMHSGAWAEFSFSLPKGKYRVEFHLATEIPSQATNEETSVGISISALENVDQTDSAVSVKEQIKRLVLDATSRRLEDEQAAALMDKLVFRAREASVEDQWIFGSDSHCDTWSLWPNEHLDRSARWKKYGDPDGMIRGWTMFMHGLLSSYGYTHD